ncbi:MAG TPA: hypothetical protein VGM41_10905 [Chitinophagaceae bacterium]|jgi:hypothetical protein
MLVFIEITLNIFVLAGMVICAALIGFIPRTSRLRKAQRTIEKLEKEMLANHAEILTLQKEMSSQTVQPSRTPIVPIRENNSEPKKETLPDPAVRKKMLSGGSQTKP